MSTTGVQITAGLGGFLVLFGLALAVWFLGRDLTRRLRRMRQRETLRQQGPGGTPERGGVPTAPPSSAQERPEAGPVTDRTDRPTSD